MKLLFCVPGKSCRIIDKDRMILEIKTQSESHKYYDINGDEVEIDERLSELIRKKDNSDEDFWNERKDLETSGTKEILIPFSIVEPEFEIDDIFGCYGFKNTEGKFIIEPQYAYAHGFTHGLAAVNLNRTWYKDENGNRCYENHFGYIDENGKTVIPFIYDKAWPFNRYGVAVTEDYKNIYLIDLNGNIIEDSNKYKYSHYYEYDDRYIEYYEYDKYYDDEEFGLYDTKERKFLFHTKYSDFEIINDDLFKVCDRKNGNYGVSDFREFFINGKEEVVYPWLKDKGFAHVDIPNKNFLSIVSVSKYTETNEEEDGYYPLNGKKYKREFVYGVYSNKERFVIPLEYERILELSNNIYACSKDNVLNIIQISENDL